MRRQSLSCMSKDCNMDRNYNVSPPGDLDTWSWYPMALKTLPSDPLLCRMNEEDLLYKRRHKHNENSVMRMLEEVSRNITHLSLLMSPIIEWNERSKFKQWILSFPYSAMYTLFNSVETSSPLGWLNSKWFPFLPNRLCYLWYRITCTRSFPANVKKASGWINW